MIYEYYGTFKIDWKKFYGTIHSEYGFEQNWLEFKRYTRSGVILDADTKTDRKTNTKINSVARILSRVTGGSPVTGATI